MIHDYGAYVRLAIESAVPGRDGEVLAASETLSFAQIADCISTGALHRIKL